MKVFSSIAVQPAVEVLLPRFIAETGITPDFEWNTAPAFVKRLQAGETADLLILNRAGTDIMVRDGRILPGSEVTLASSPAAIAVKTGTPKPDISTPEALKRTLLAARAISYTDPAAGGASGIHFAKVLEQMGIADEINAKNRFPPAAGSADGSCRPARSTSPSSRFPSSSRWQASRSSGRCLPLINW